MNYCCKAFEYDRRRTEIQDVLGQVQISEGEANASEGKLNKAAKPLYHLIWWFLRNLEESEELVG